MSCSTAPVPVIGTVSINATFELSCVEECGTPSFDEMSERRTISESSIVDFHSCEGGSFPRSSRAFANLRYIHSLLLSFRYGEQLLIDARNDDDR